MACSVIFAIVQVAAADKPNVVVIVGDDMGYADIGVHGCKDIPTPNIDALAAGGVRCTNGYVSGPYCSPTRAGLLTGRYQTRFGHEFNPGPAPGKVQRKQQRQLGYDEKAGIGLPLSETTIADRLKSADYATALVGKWHLGHADPYHPLRRGFDEYFGFLGGAHSYFPGNDARIFRGEEPVEENEYLTDAFGREAVAFLERQTANRPFFLCLSFNAVHTPMHADEARLEKFKSIRDEKRRTYAAMMSAMDDAIGAVLAKLQEKKLDDNTMVFFISDNGGPSLSTTTVNGSINRPLRGSKRTTLEGGIRVPFLVKWPARLPTGKVYDQPVIQLDILPTVLAAAGIEADPDTRLDGVNMLPYLRGESEGPPHDALYWRFGQQMAIRQGDWKLVKYDPAVDGLKGKATQAKLYNLASDIGESKNLIAEEPERAKTLQATWDRWNASNMAAAWGDGGKGKKAKARKQQRQAAARRAAEKIPDGN
ncbi:MAG: sulfatase [Planctomycetes bacterium]|nr:sulfatase [Planctomycetota bacterium]